MRRYAVEVLDTTTGEDATFDVASWADPDAFNSQVRRGPDDTRPDVAERVSCAAVPNTQFPAGHLLQWRLVAEGFTLDTETSPWAFFRPLGSDGPPPQAETVTLLNAGAVREGARAVFKLRLDRPTPLPLSVTVTTVSRSAKARQDFKPVTSVVRFPSDARTASVKVKTLRDKKQEGRETFLLKVAELPADLRVTGGTATATIKNRP